MTQPLGPRVDLTMVGDWGTANFHTILGWISAHMRWRSAPLSKFTIRTGSAYRDGVEQVGRGDADLTITTPAHLGVRWARDGEHFYGCRGFPNLRTLGALPQDDRLTLAVDTATGITSFSDLRERRYPLRLACPNRDYDSLVSYAVDRILSAHGIEPDDIIKWGGSFLEHENPRACINQAIRGEADAVFNEAIMVSNWRELVTKRSMRFLPIEPEAMQLLTDTYGMKPAQIEANRLENPEAVDCLDWSNWAIVVRDDMPEDLAYRITAVMVEERGEFEARFHHMPVHQSPLTYPIDPVAMCTTADIDLHPGAERYYREHGWLRR